MVSKNLWFLHYIFVIIFVIISLLFVIPENMRHSLQKKPYCSKYQTLLFSSFALTCTDAHCPLIQQQVVPKHRERVDIA